MTPQSSLPPPDDGSEIGAAFRLQTGIDLPGELLFAPMHRVRGAPMLRVYAPGAELYLGAGDLERFRSAKAKVYVEHSDIAVPVDFLQDRIVAEVEIDQPTGRQRLLEAPVALDAMRRAWQQFEDTDKVLEHLDSLEGKPLQVPTTLIDNRTL